MMVYHYEKSDPKENRLELKFCVSGNMYCRQKETECNMCRAGVSNNCADRSESVDVLSFSFSPALLSQFVKARSTSDTLSENILNFNHQSSFTRILPLCSKTRMVIDSLLNHNYIDSLENIYKAREVLIQHIGEPITIKELSRKVAMNECYLKKGFKEMFGTTIFDFYQSQRMEHARFLLYEKGLSVTEVSMLLGYSSISHFSTAFKKHTGLKPCELLLR